MEHTKEKIMVLLIIISTILLAIVISQNTKQKGKEEELIQKLEQIDMPAKAIYQEQISFEEIKKYEIELKKNIDKYLEDNLETNYENADKGNLVLRSMFAISGGETILDKESSHEDRVEFLKLFTYKINTTSGFLVEENMKKSIHLMTQIHVYYDEHEIENPAPYIMFFLDEEGNITGGTFYGTI